MRKKTKQKKQPTVIKKFLQGNSLTAGFLTVSLFLLITVTAIGITRENKTATANTHQIVVDHTSIDLFDQIPPEYLEAAKNTRMMYSDRSFGQNINEALNCLTATSWSTTPAHCRVDYYQKGRIWRTKTYTQRDMDAGTVPSAITYTPDPVKYDRSNWTFEFKMGSWSELTQSFIQEVGPAYNETKDVISYQFSYLNVDANDDIANPTNGFFANNERTYDIYDYENYISQHPEKTFIFWTTSLARNNGTSVSENFNNQMRSYALANNKILFDVADIISHREDGSPCYDNRDGVEYCNREGNCENFPDDGQNIPAICQEYTTELEGGHLGSTSAGKIRIAKALWVLMAQVAGWNPDGQSIPPSTTPVPSATPVITPTPTATPIPTVTPTPAPSATATPIPSATPGAYGEPIYRWTFDTNSITPTIGTCSSCTINGAVWNSEGFRTGAFDFLASNAKLNLKNLPVGRNSNNAFTISGMFKPYFDENDSSFHTLYSQAGTLNIAFIPSMKDFRIQLRTSTGTTYRMDTSELEWDPNTWHHVVLTFDGSVMRFYWDGDQKAFANVSGTLPEVVGNFYLGLSEVNTNPFTGMIDDLEIYDTAIVPN